MMSIVQYEGTQHIILCVSPCHTPGDSDYIATPTTVVTFSSGSTSRTVTVMAEGDNVIEDDETFTLSLTSTDTAIDMLMPQSATVTITDQTSKYIHCHINWKE